MNEKVQNKIESEQFQANRENYLLTGDKNWSLLHKHVYLVEQYSKKHFGGKNPAKKDVTAVLEKELDSSCGELGCTTMSRSNQKRNREDNPAKLKCITAKSGRSAATYKTWTTAMCSTQLFN